MFNKLNENSNNNSINTIEEFYLLKENKTYTFEIKKRKYDIIIQCLDYEEIISPYDFSLKIDKKYNDSGEIYEFIISLFKNRKVFIKEILFNTSIKLQFKINILNEQKDIEIYLRNKNKIHLNPNDLIFSNDLVYNSYSFYSFLDNIFAVFKSIDNIIYLIYSNKKKSIISYNVVENKKINEIKNAHQEYITNFRYFFDQTEKRDLIISISSVDNNLKLWKIIEMQCLLVLKNVNKEGNLYSACFLKFENENYIVTSNHNFYGPCEPIKIFDFEGNKIKEINESEDKTYFLDIYQDINYNITFIITGNKNNIKSYDFNNNELFQIYDDNDNKGHYSIIIYNKNNIIKLIESSDDRNIRIWNFYSGELLNKIKISKNYNLNGLCLWNEEYILVGCYDKSIKLIDINKGIIIKNLINHTSRVLTIKKIFHPEYGECLISGGLDEKIKLWIVKK